MFSPRRRSRGHYDRGTYNTGLSTPSAAAAASASMNRQSAAMLSSSAAAEALRRHSLDQSGADAIANFQPDGGARRASSLTAAQIRAYHQQSPLPTQPRSYRMSPNRPSSRTNSLTRSNSLMSGRTNSLNSQSGRSDSMTRTHTVVNRDEQGRTLSLTTTTVRQMGSFELTTTKETPVTTPGRRTNSNLGLRRPQTSFTGGYADSVHSIDSELAGIREEEEPISLPILEENPEDTDPDAMLDPPPTTARFSPPPRDHSPAKPALRTPGTTRTRAGSEASENEPKARVSFGGAPKEFVYESYDYDEPEQSGAGSAPGMAAAAAASRSRTKPADQATLQHHQAAHAAAASTRGTAAPLNVRKRPSNQSLTGARPSTAAYQQVLQPKEAPPAVDDNDDAESVYSDAPDSPEAVAKINAKRPGVPERSALRTTSQPSGPHQHHYRALLSSNGDADVDGRIGGAADDDVASIASDSSFRRERRRSTQRPAGSGMIGSLRAQPPQPSQVVPQLQSPQATQGFRTYSLRNQDRPDPSRLMGQGGASNGKANHSTLGRFGTLRSQPPKKSTAGNGFHSRITESDSDDDQYVSNGGGHHFGQAPSAERNHGGSGHGGRITLRDVFSPNSDAKMLLGKRSSSDNMAVRDAQHKKQNFLKRLFSRNKH